ncbi:MraY family glycosyltransferase [Ammoniphilus sp. CFH 90114]|uniref:MraY family glycosyltransferase n=1 Tax=Ammoniphilus sp. CFH 90114 TaxID=2493665 RepID=UPI00100E39EF|nr:MraY family glycosyltransferase [Ammoniphilus sp. CFH 90114]RXT08127.1 undecaprenyl/decaprenyl-phosphate alpha-N-acetylglucosaminyl 1-phosphate transferase [Ammoniphilus sp. CFH 90114]
MKYLLLLSLSYLLCYFLLPLFKRLSFYWGILDQPSARKIHAKPIPLLGGLLIYLTVASLVLLFLGINRLSLGIVVGGAILVTIGLLDDWYKSKGREFYVWPRLLAQVGAAGVIVALGIRIDGITNFFVDHGMIMFPDWLATALTILWIVAITNMMNFIDGVDGLAAGITSISSMTLFFIALIQGQYAAAMVAIILMGAVLAFLKYNFHPASIFMGDSGATFLGFTLAVIAVDGAFKGATLASIFVPVFALGVPIFDTLIVFLKRFLSGKGLHIADRSHTHHTLMRWGLNQKQTVAFLYLIGACLSLTSIVLLLYSTI